MSDAKVEALNVNHPGQVTNVNAEKYQAMKTAMLETLPNNGPGLTHKEMIIQIKPSLPESVFPGGATSGWWVKCVQLDLEARQMLVREDTKPLRWHKTK